MTTNLNEQVVPTTTPVVVATGLNLDRTLTGLRGVGSKPFLKPRDPNRPPSQGPHPERLLE